MADQTYRVVAGDNLWHIAKQKLGAGHRWPEIYAMNHKAIRDPNLIHVGQVLTLPPRDRYGIPDPHPLQRSKPQITPLRHSADPHPMAASPQTPAPHAHSAVPGYLENLIRTTVNNTALKIELKVVPEVTMSIPQGEVKISWTGTMYFWKDGTRPLTTIGNRGLEISEKQEFSALLPHLLESKKLSLGLDGKVTYEDLMGQVSYGGSTTTVSQGIAIISSFPFLAYRTQVKVTGRAGKFRNWLFYSPETRINFDVTIKPQPPTDATAMQLVRSLAPSLLLTPAPVPAGHIATNSAPAPGRIAMNPGSAPAHPSTLQEIGNWTSEHKQAIEITAFVGATIVLGILTLGGSTVVEGLGAAALTAARMGAGVVAARLATGAAGS